MSSLENLKGRYHSGIQDNNER